MSGNEDERVREEIEALEAILIDDVTVEYNESGQPERIKTVVFPSTADDTKQQYVCISLEVELNPGYPDVEPVVLLRNPRGLDDSLIQDIEQAVKTKCSECLGQPVVFELIELIRERLTESNVPSCQCAVCLYGFSSGDQFSKTACYHYFHSYCLARLVRAAERAFQEEIERLPAWQRRAAPTQSCTPLCPVCREPLQGITCGEAQPPRALETQRAFEATAELRALQARMAALFLRQQQRGGIIDVAAEENKLLVLTSNTAEEVVQEAEASAPAPPVVPSGSGRAPRTTRASHSRRPHKSRATR